MTSFQIELCKELLEAKDFSAFQFLKKYCGLETKSTHADSSFEAEYRFPDYEDAFNRFMEFITLVEFLETEDLILKKVLGMPPNRDTPMFKAFFVPNSGNDFYRVKLSMLFKEYQTYTYLYTPSLKIFVVNGCRTWRELEALDRRGGQRWTLGIAIGTVVISLLGSAVINYVIYSKQRVVTIDNFNQSRDSLNINLMNPIPVKIELDSIR